MVDVQSGMNSYYKLQLLKHDNKEKYYVYRSWGRVGTIVGGSKLEDFRNNLQDALDSFLTVYQEKTGNAWKDRKNFVKYPYHYYPMDLDYGGEEETRSKIKAGSQSKLAKAVQDLMQMIFDIETMKRTMLDFEIDLKKMPLGKISKRQIKTAYEVLTEIQNLLDAGTATQTQILDASNRFFTLIPHDFGLKKPPLLDNLEIVKEKCSMLDNLLEIEIAYGIMKTDEADSEKDPIDAHYEKLHAKIEPVEKKSEEFTRLADYVKKTHAATHNTYDLEVVEAFKIVREGESGRYKPFKKLSNRMMLWHGSRLSNWAGILSQGLRIAPPEAPATGYMFGKGIYFADMVSKSANYCFTSRSNNTGLLLLAEVALGEMYEKTQAEMITKLPNGKHSTKGCGSTAPAAKTYFKDADGVIWPIGEGVNSGVKNTSLLYNEYIVYDVAQVNMRYLLQLKFNYKF